jgi:hypothetical protein
MTEVDSNPQLRAVFGRMILQMAVVWAATMIGGAVAAKASDDFIWVLFVLVSGFVLSSAVLESGRRHAMVADRR